MGHVRDLPAKASEIPSKYKNGKKTPRWVQLGVNVDQDFEPLYIIPPDKKKVIQSLKAALKNADTLYIATDEDREGESIGWHLLQVLKPKVPVRRMVFHEITQKAIREALNHTRQVDQRLVDAQETRRILDRLVGYEISPLLWRKIAPKLSAGRVQSAAVRLLVQRESDRIRFVSAGYWGLKADLEKDRHGFEAEMTHYAGTRLATGRDFNEETGQLSPDRKVLLLQEEQAKSLSETLAKAPWRVQNVEQRDAIRKPYPPFITSTLQQESNRKLGLSARQTMRTAQKLYEQGLITYMRTDSTHLSQEAITASRQAIQQRYGANYLSPSPRQFASKSKNAQEAHEAIRPAGTAMKTRDDLRLSGKEGALYDLIWKRTVASQMANARLKFTNVTLEAGDAPDALALFRSSGKQIVFPGFFRAYVEGSDDPEAALENQEAFLPPLAKGDQPTCLNVEASGHETKPPTRFTEASLVKELEKLGIGRPSTYASIISTIMDRGYGNKKGKQLIPTFTAFATNQLLEHQFDTMVDFNFTAKMEQTLDDIAAGHKEAIPYLKQFYFDAKGLKPLVEGGIDNIDARAVSTISFKKWQPFVIRVGRYGPYVEGPVDGNVATASLPEETPPDAWTPKELETVLRAKEKDDHILGIHPEHNLPVLLKEGPYGHYVQLGDDAQEGKPHRMSLPKGVTPDQVDLSQAINLLALPRTIGMHPETGEPIMANIGRYGPYVQQGRTFASVAPPDDVLTVTLARALKLIAAKQKPKNEPIRTMGAHPETGEPVVVLNGRYGPYVKHQRINASLPKGTDPQTLTMESALALLAARASKKKTTRRKKRK